MSEIPRIVESSEAATVQAGRLQGKWNLLGRDEEAPREERQAQDSDEGQIQLVAGGGFEPPTFGL
jgi:hypothetical protein